MVWCFADIAISTNLARDLGTRIVAAIFFGGESFSYLNYSWIAILVNIPATIFATGYYEFLRRDSLSAIGKGHAVHEHGEEGLKRHITNTVSLLLFAYLDSHGVSCLAQLKMLMNLEQGHIETDAANALQANNSSSNKYNLKQA